MARKMLVMEEPLFKDGFGLSEGGDRAIGVVLDGDTVAIKDPLNATAIEETVNETAIEDPLNATAIEEAEDDKDGCSLALKALLKEVPYMQMMNKMVPYSPQCVGGIQLRDGDGSIGYFTAVGGGGQNFQVSQISPILGYYVPYPQFPMAHYPSGPYGWQSHVSPLSATSSRQGGYVPILPLPRPPVTPPSHASQR